MDGQVVDEIINENYRIFVDNNDNIVLEASHGWQGGELSFDYVMQAGNGVLTSASATIPSVEVLTPYREVVLEFEENATFKGINESPPCYGLNCFMEKYRTVVNESGFEFSSTTRRFSGGPLLSLTNPTLQNQIDGRVLYVYSKDPEYLI